LVSGTSFKIDPKHTADSILISQKIADKMQFKTGDKLLMYFIQQPPRVRKFIVAGIYNTGLEDFDAKYLIGDIKQIKKLNNWDSSLVAGFEITVDDFKQVEKITDEVNELVEVNVLAKSIREQFPQLFDWLKLQDVNVEVILILMLLVAMVNMVSALIILILENTKLIGIFKALGSTNWQLRKIFLYQASHLIGKGLLYGNIAALSLCFLQSYFHFIKLDETSYYIAYVPIKIDLFYFFLINFGTLFLCTLVLLIPSALIAKVSPSKAIRFS
jgi:lipoprotein-releasing system permease protein